MSSIQSLSEPYFLVISILIITMPQKGTQSQNKKPKTKFACLKVSVFVLIIQNCKFCWWIIAFTISGVLLTLRLILVFRLDIFHSKTLLHSVGEGRRI